MGYITDIIFMSAFRKDGKPDDENIEDQIHEEVDGETGLYGTKLNDDPSDDVISEISRKYPDFIIEVEGRGGDQEDLWRRRYHNDKYETISPVWPEYQNILYPEPNGEATSTEKKESAPKKVYQPIWYHDDGNNIDYGDLPEELTESDAFASREDCYDWLSKHNYDVGDFCLIEHEETDIENLNIIE